MRDLITHKLTTILPQINIKHSSIQLSQMPDGVIMNVSNKSENVEVLYSLINVNIHLDQSVDDDMIVIQNFT